NNDFVTKVVVPEGVTKLGYSAFSGMKRIKEIKLPQSLTYIDGYCFSDLISIKELIIPKNVTTIGWCLFMYSAGFETIIFEGDEVIEWGGTFMFYECTNLRNIRLPDGLKSLGYGAFRQCNSLTSIVLPKALSDLTGAQEFNRCGNLESITVQNPIPASVVSSTFKRGNPNRKIYVPTGTLAAYTKAWSEVAATEFEEITTNFTITDNVLTGYNGTGGYVVVPAGVTEIAADLFANNTAITGVFVPEFVTKIGANCFKGAINMTTAKLPSTLKEIPVDAFNGAGLVEIALPVAIETIGDRAFKDNAAMTKLKVTNRTPATLGSEAIDLNNANLVIEIPEKTTAIYTEKWADYAKFIFEENPFKMDGTVLIAYTGIGGDVIVPEGITEIIDSVFASNLNLISIIMPSSLTKIGDKAFAGCIDLQRVIMPDSVTTLGEEVFKSCSSLNYIEYSKGLAIIPEFTFQFCSSLQHFEISETVTTFGNYAFCSSGLLEVVIPATIKDVGM
ncbi:MAG: leucine-rich repeat domain-containing protein, partial [Clostridia bacterium]